MNFFQAQFRTSTSRMYNQHWEKWSKWCRDNGVKDPMRPRAAHIAGHLSYLAQTFNLSAATLRSRRAAIGSVLATRTNNSVATDPLISGVLKGIANSQHRTPRLVPEWDLAVVLDLLKSPKYENNKLLPHDLLTYKTAFLIALASGRRASEITNLSGLRGDVHLAPQRSLSLKFLPEFLAKNQVPGDPAPSILIPPLTKEQDQSKLDRALCPVRALIEYRRRSDSYRSPSQRALFISVKKNHAKDITRATLSRWLKTLIRQAYLELDGKGKLKPTTRIPTGKIRAHEIRAWAATMASTSSSISEVMKAAYWRSPTVFTRHYLRDIAMRSEDGTLRLPAMVAAQSCLPPRK